MLAVGLLLLSEAGDKRGDFGARDAYSF